MHKKEIEEIEDEEIILPYTKDSDKNKEEELTKPPLERRVHIHINFC